MGTIKVTLEKNIFGDLARQFPAAVNRGMRKQVLVSERDVVTNIQRYDLIDTGNMMGSVKGDTEAMEVSVNAESEKGYPYPWIQNYGGRKIPRKPFFSEAVRKAEDEFPGRVRREIDRAMG